jgi:hypothetical protein
MSELESSSVELCGLKSHKAIYTGPEVSHLLGQDVAAPETSLFPMACMQIVEWIHI